MTTQLLRREIADQVRALPDDALCSLAGLVFRPKRGRRPKGAPDVGRELVALRSAVESTLARLEAGSAERLAAHATQYANLATELEGAYQSVANLEAKLRATAQAKEEWAQAAGEERQRILMLRDEIADVRNQLGEMTAQRDELEGGVLRAEEQLDEAMKLGGVYLEDARLRAAERCAAVGRAELAEAALAESALELEAQKRAYLDFGKVAVEQVDALKAELAEMTTARDHLAERVLSNVDAGLVTGREAALDTYARQEWLAFWARTWKAAAKEYRSCWLLAQKRAAGSSAEPSRLVVPTNFHKREQERLRSGFYERDRPVGEDAPGDAYASLDEEELTDERAVGEEPGKGAPRAKGARKKSGGQLGRVGAKSRRKGS